MPCLAIAACFASLNADALPLGPQVVAGTAGFDQTGKVLTVTNSNGAIINWDKFSIKAGETTHFAQTAASSTVLNRVLNDPTAIYGTLSSNGRVWLVNPAGILVGPGGRVDTAGFVASTLGVRNEDFLASRKLFINDGSAQAVINQGELRTPDGGSVYLIGSAVDNAGIITTPAGETILAAGTKVELIDSATPGVRVEITGGEGNATNLGQIAATAGRIGIAAAMVSNGGSLNASSVVSEGGRIFLRATKKLELTQSSRVGADGTVGGSITAIASENGQISGELVARGEISAQGSGSPGSGGFVETSAAAVRIEDGFRINSGGGRWLIDPLDFTIAAGSGGQTTSGIGATTLQTALGSGSVTIQTDASTGGNGDIFVNSAVSWSSANSLTLQAHRNIDVNASLTSSGTGTINLYADYISPDGVGAIQRGSSGNIISQAAGTVTLRAGSGIVATVNGTSNVLDAQTTGGSMELEHSSGTLAINANTAFQSLSVSGGTLNGTGNITVTTGGSFTWTNGVISGSGTLTTQSGVATTLSPGFAQTVALRDSRIWDNYGTVTFTPNSGTLSYFQIDDTLTGGTAVFSNKPGALFDVNASFSDTHVIGVGTFNNEGELRKSLNTSVATSGFVPAFNNLTGGVVNVNSGTLRFDTGGTDAGNYVLANGATLQFNGGPRSISGNIGGTGNVTFSKPQTATAVYTLTGDYNISGTTTAALDDLGSSGDVLFNGTVTNLGSSYVQSGGITNVSFAGITGGGATGFQNLTSITLNEGHLTFANGTSLTGLTTLTRAGGYGSTLDLANNNLSLLNLNVTGGTITGSGNISVSGAFAFSKGLLSGSGTLTTQLGSTTTLAPGFAQTASLRGSRTWDNYGTINFTTPGGALTYFEIDDTLTGGTAVFNNQASGVFNINASFSDNHTTGVGTFNNFGLVTKNLNGSAATSGINPVLINQSGGVINVNSGTLSLNGSNTYSAGSSISAAGGSTLQFGGGTQTFSGNAAVTGTGATVLFAGGTVINTAAANDFSILNNSSWSVTNGTVSLSAGNLTDFSSPVSVTGGSLTLSTGNAHSFNAGLSIGVSNSVTFSSADDVTIPSGQTLVANLFSTITGVGTLNTNGTTSFGNNGFNLNGKTWNNAGVIDIGATNGYINLLGAAVLNNNAGGTININSGANANPITIGSGSVNNYGIINKQAGSPATTTIAAVFANQAGGVVNVNEGTLVLSGTGNSYAGTSAINVGNGSTLQISGGSHSFNSGSALNTTGGALVFSGGTSTFNSGASIGFDTAITFSGGTTSFNTGATKVNTGTVTLSGGTLNGSDNFVFNNLVWSNGTLSGADASTMTTAGTVTMAGAAAATQIALRDWTNLASGTIQLTGAASEISLQGSAGTTTFTNAGAINYSGTTANAWPVAWRGSSAGTVFVNSGSFTKTSSSASKIEVAAFTNSGTLNVNAGSLSVVGGTFTQSGNINVATASTFARSGGFTNAGGVLSGSGTIDVGAGNTLINQGTIRPGGSGAAATLALTGNLDNSAGSIEAELGGSVAGTGYDVLAVSGSATLGGTLNAPLINGFAPSNQSFDILTAGSASGSFGTSNLPVGVNGAIVGSLYRLTHTGAACSGVCWDGGAGTSNWTDAANWTGNALPGSTDVADLNLIAGVTINLANSSQVIKGLNSTANNHLVIATGGVLTLTDPGTTSTLAGNLTISGGTLNANGTLSLANLIQSAGILAGTGVVSVGTFAWTGGTLTGSGAIAVNTALNMPAGTAPNAWNYTFLDGKNLTNNGVATFGSNQDQGGNGADLRLQNGATVFNAGTWNINYANINSTGVNTFNNSGTLNVGALGNGGTINATLASSGALNVFNDGLILGGGGSVTGDLSVSGGTLVGTINLAPANFSLGAGAALATTGSLAVGNSFSNSGGSFSGSFSSIDITQAAGALAVPALSAANAIALNAPSGTVTVNGTLTTTAASSSIVVAGTGFSNAVGAGVFSVGSGGRWLVYATNPASVTKNGLTSNFRHYGSTLGSYAPGSVVESGNGFIYASALASLSVNASATGVTSHVYGDAPTASFGYTLTGFADAEDNAGNIGLSGAAGFNLPTAGSNAGSYTVSYVGGLSSLAGYSFSAGTGVAYNVTQAPLTITAGSLSKIYGDTLGFAGTEFSATGLKNGQVVGGVTLLSSGAIAAAGVGGSPYAITASAATGGSFNPANYSISYANGVLTVSPRLLTVNFAAPIKIYDGNTTATLGSYALSNLANGDALGLAATTAVYDSRHVGTAKTVSYSGLSLTGGAASNYSLASTATGAGSITQLASVAWSGGSSGNWSVATNWAGGALPDGANVAAVSIPALTAVTFDAATAATKLGSLLVGSGGSFIMAGSSLDIAGALTTPGYSQSGGILGGTGSLTASQSFAKSGGTLALTGPININQAAGNLAFVNDAALMLGAVSTANGSIDIDTAGGILTTASPVSANGGALSLTAHSPITIGSGGLSATGGISLSATTPAAGSTITLGGPLLAGGAVNVAAYGAITQNAGVQGQNIAMASASGNIVIGSGAVSSVPAGGSIRYSATAGSITSSPGNFAGAAPTLVAAGSGDATGTSTTTNDIASSVTKTTEALSSEKPSAPETSAPLPTETSSTTLLLATSTQTTGGDSGTFGASPEPIVGAGSTPGNPAADTAPAAASHAADQPPAKGEEKKDGGKEKAEKKESRPREEKKREERAATKKVAQCS